MDKWPGSEDPPHTGIQVAFNTDKHWFEVLGSDPERLKRFEINMKSFSEGVGYEVDFLAEHYLWGVGEGTVVDVSSDPIFGLTCIGLSSLQEHT
jgi:hypothetical protein